MKKKFKIFYADDHPDKDRRGCEYRSGNPRDMLVMNAQGIFFVYRAEPYYPSMTRLFDKIGPYRVEWLND